MDYETMVQEIHNLDFIPDPDTADAALKAALGIFASRMHEPQARRFTADLPQPLTMEKLYSQQGGASLIEPADYFLELSNQFQINDQEARRLAKTAIRLAKQTVGDEAMIDIKEHMPPEWRHLIQEA